jgi:adenosylhomocysteine nucleosidase
MKNYLVVCAMKEEFDAFFAGASYKVMNYGGIETYVLINKSSRVYGIIGGIGKVNMAYRLGKMLGLLPIDEIINVGVAGSISSKLPPLKTLVASSCAYHDVDVTAFGYAYGQMASEPLYYECDKEEVKKALSLDRENTVSGLILSGDAFLTKGNLSSKLFEHFEDPISCDMESAAVAQVAYNEKIPFVIIRSISDDASGNETNKDQYNKLLEEASHRASVIARKLIED